MRKGGQGGRESAMAERQPGRATAMRVASKERRGDTHPRMCSRQMKPP